MNTERKPMRENAVVDTGRILAGLGLQAVNPGAWSGKEWHAAADAPLIDSINPATGEVIARVRAAGTDDYERVMASALGGIRRLARRACSAARRGRATHGRGLAREERPARQPRQPRDGQDQGRRRRRSPGNDRHGRFCRRPVAHALRPCDALRAPAAPDVRAMASARRGRHHLGVQFPGRGLVLERLPRRGLRRHQRLEALAPHAALRDRGAAHLQ